jgi:hypothetical protein
MDTTSNHIGVAQGVDVVRPLVGAHGLQVHHVAHAAVVVDDAVGAEHVAPEPGDPQGDVDVVHLGERDHRGPELAAVLELREPQRHELGLGDLGRHPDELLLRELLGGERRAEDDALLRVAQGLVEAGQRGADRAPGDAVARLRETGERPLQASRPGQPVRLGDRGVLEVELARDRGAQRELPLDVADLVAGASGLDQEALDSVLGLGPDHGQVGDGAVRDPALGPVQDPGVPLAHRLGAHAARVGAEVGLGQPEAADRVAARHQREPAILLRLRSVGVDRVHAEGALNRSEAPQPGIAALELLHDEPVGNAVHPGAAVAAQVRPEEADLGHLRDQLHGEGAVLPHVLDDARQELPLNEVAHRVPHEPLFGLEQILGAVEIERLEWHGADSTSAPRPPQPPGGGRDTAAEACVCASAPWSAR